MKSSTFGLCAALSAAAFAPAAAAPAEYVLTPTHSFVHFEIRHAELSTLRGRFNRVAGRVTLDREARRGSGSIDVGLASIDTGRPAFDQALRTMLGADGDSETRASFAIESMRFEGGHPAAAAGTLRLRKAATPFELRAHHFNCYLNPLLRRQICGGEFVAMLSLARLGLVIDPALLLGSDVVLRVQVEAVVQAD